MVKLPACALTTPTKRECQQQTPVESVNDPAARTVTAVAATDASVYAVTASAAGSSGSFAATSMSASGSWAAGGMNGDFTWSYPFDVPDVAGDLTPDLALGYSSQSVDGRVTASNNQPSWIGEGWDLTQGFIERPYKPCVDDMGGNGNNTAKTGDLCWAGDKAAVSFGAHSGELVRDVGSGQWRLRHDDGTRFEKVVNGWANGDNDKESWKVTTTDGTQYYFGRGKANTSSADTSSTWTAPVFGNNPGEPCNAAAYAASSCSQAWRWNLDHVIDVHGNSMTLYYTAETNNYGRNLNTAVSTYTRGGYLTRIEYGQRTGQEHTVQAPARVVFTVGERCLVTGTQKCAGLSSGSASAYPDVPFDQVCGSTTSCASRTSPTFFSQKRLTQVQTQVLAGSSYTEVERWSLEQSFPNPGDGTTAALWLAKITHAGANNTSPTPPVTFAGVQLDNRVDGVETQPGQVAPPMIKYRIGSIKSESGGATLVNYSAPDCTTTSLPATPESNTRRCFPVWFIPDGQSQAYRHYFHKYVVNSVSNADLSGASGSQVRTTYTYEGAPAWRYDDLTLDKNPTWNLWAGYGKVRTVTGDPASATSLRTDTLYYRGLDGSRATPAGGTRSMSITDSQGGVVPDTWRFAGQARESISYNGVSGPEVSATIADFAVLATTATGADGHTANLAGAVKERTRTARSSSGPRTTEETTTYDTLGSPSETQDLGDTAVATDDSCTRVKYVRNTGSWLLDTEHSVSTRATKCADWPAAPTKDQVLEESRTYYDGLPLGQIGRGLPTKEEEATSFSGGTPTFATTSQTTYDALGRPLAVTDALGAMTTTAYTPNGAGVPATVSTTSPDPDGSGPLTPHTSTTTYDPKWGLPTKVVGVDGTVSEVAYDTLGRATSLWYPGRARASFPTSPSVRRAYTTSANGPTSVTTEDLKWNGGYSRSVQLYDGLLRPRQTQTETSDQKIAANGTSSDTAGRLVSDTLYDDRGLVITERGPVFATGAPGTTVLNVNDADVPSQTRATYDGASRVVKQTLLAYGQTKWSTGTVYDGDRVHTTPPAGGTATTEIHDAEGRTTALRRYEGTTTTGAYDETAYAYTPDDQLASMTDPAGNKWTYAYDLLGREIQSNDPDAGQVSTTYDLAGQVQTTKDARGQTLAYTYDTLGRTTSMRDATPGGAKRADWVYDTVRKGALSSSTRYLDGKAVTARTVSFDDAGRPLQTEMTVPTVANWIEAPLAKTYTATNSYHPDGSPDTVVLSSMGNLTAEEFTYRYDNLGRQVGLGGDGSYVRDAIWSAYGPLNQLATGSETNNYSWTTNQYDLGTGRLTGTSFNRQSVAKNDLDIGYTYDDAGALSKIKTVHPQTAEATDTQCFGMDHLQRLTQAWTPASGDCAAAPTVAGLGGSAPYWLNWTFDKASNRLSQTGHAAAGNTTTTWAYPAAGGSRPHAATSTTVAAPGKTATTTPLSYDATGKVTGRTSTAGAVPGSTSKTQTLAWGAEGHLDSATTGAEQIRFAYDADGGQLVRRDGATTTLYVGSTEITLNRSTNSVTANRYLQFGGQTVAVRTGPNSSNVSTLWSDLNNTASWQVSRTTNAIATRQTLPYGEPRGTTAAFQGTHGFVDGTNDPALGLVHVGARAYDPTSGRFLSPDPILDTADPTSWNAYGYGDGNPIIHPDPSGLNLGASHNRNAGSYYGGYFAPRDNPHYGKKRHGTVKGHKPKSSGRMHASRPSQRGNVSRGRSHRTTYHQYHSAPSHHSSHHASHKSSSDNKSSPAPKPKPTMAQRAKKWLSSHSDIIGTVAAVAAGVILGAVFCGVTAGIGCAILIGAAASAVGYGTRVGLSDEETFDPVKFSTEVGLGAIPLGGFGAGRLAARGGASKLRTLGAEVCGHRSFSSQTLILMADGTQKPISEVNVGDRIVSTDPATGQQSVETVTHLWIHQDTLYHLSLSTGEILTTTEDHPFYNATDRAWEDTQNLHPGDQLLTARSTAPVTVDHFDARSWTDDTAYNLTVTGPHTYHVGRNATLVHNCGRHMPDQQSLIELAKEAKRRGGVAESDGRELYKWSQEYGLGGHPPLTHPNRGGWSGTNPHITVGPIRHIPVIR